MTASRRRGAAAGGTASPASAATRGAGPGLSRAQQDYLKQIQMIAEAGGTATTRALAEKLDVRPASVTGMLKKLAAEGLVEHEPYRGVRLTDRGRDAALKLVRLHRLIETFLHDVLGYRWDEVHEEAERLEHVVSEIFERRIADALGNPTRDPHGDPIPSSELALPDEAPVVTLPTLRAGQTARIERVLAQDGDTLGLLARLRLHPGAVVRVNESRGDGVSVTLDGERFLLPRAVADGLLVARGDS